MQLMYQARRTTFLSTDREAEFYVRGSRVAKEPLERRVPRCALIL